MVDVSVTATSSDQNLTDSPHYLAETLIKNGVKHMYGVVGIPVTDFARIAQGMGIRFIGMRHEEDAVNAAAAEGFLTGRPAVALTVSAPGFLNGLAPLLEATTNGFPVIMIGGSSTRHVVDMHEGEYEGLDQMNYAKQFCKESFRIDKIEDIPLAVARAMHIACSGRPGGVYIDFPDDAVAQTLDKDVAESQLWVANQPAPAMPPAQSSVDEALKLLSEAKNPLMLVGKGAALAQAEGGNLRWVAQDEALVTYAEKIAKGELNLDPAESAVANDRRVRASGAAHPARAVVAGRPLTVLAARVADDAPADRLGSGAAALIANRLLLGCAEGVLEVTEVKPDGKRAMDARSFAAGVPALRGEEGTWSRA